MIKTHLKYLYTAPIQKAFILMVLMVGAVLYTTSEYKTKASMLLFLDQQYQQDYILQGLSLIKFLTLIVVVLSWIYATKISRYNVYLCIRHQPKSVLYSQFLILCLLGLGLVWLFLSLFVIVWLLYPGQIPLHTICSLFLTTTIWVIHYHLLCFLFNILFHHIFALMVPFIGYVVGMMQNGIITTHIELDNSPFLLPIVFPDILFVENSFQLRFSAYIYLTFFLLVGLVIWKLLQKKDIDIYL